MIITVCNISGEPTPKHIGIKKIIIQPATAALLLLPPVLSLGLTASDNVNKIDEINTIVIPSKTSIIPILYRFNIYPSQALCIKQ